MMNYLITASSKTSYTDEKHTDIISIGDLADLERLHHHKKSSSASRLSVCLRAAAASIMLLTTALFLLPLLHSSSAFPTLQQPLRFTRDGTFQVCVFEDLHFGEAENLDWGPQQDINTTRVMNSVLDDESPQLVVINGDLITGENTYLYNSTYYIDRIVQPMVQRGLSWASNYGQSTVCCLNFLLHWDSLHLDVFLRLCYFMHGTTVF